MADERKRERVRRLLYGKHWRWKPWYWDYWHREIVPAFVLMHVARIRARISLERLRAAIIKASGGSA